MEGLVKKIKGIRNEMIGLSIVLMLAGGIQLSKIQCILQF